MPVEWCALGLAAALNLAQTKLDLPTPTESGAPTLDVEFLEYLGSTNDMWLSNDNPSVDISLHPEASENSAYPSVHKEPAR